MSVDRAPAQYCPYCGETDLWPNEAGHGAWECHACGRVFTIKFAGLAGRAVRGSQAGDGEPVDPVTEAAEVTR